MPFIENQNTSHYTIHSYTPGSIRINDVTYQRSILLSPSQLITDWPPQRVNELTAQHIAALLQLNPEVVLLGTGTQQHFLDPELLSALMAKHIGFEVMNTTAACHTFNLLATEGRRVAAGLLLL